MKKQNITYWIFTGLMAPSFAIGSIFELMGDPKSVEIITGLGYPAYLSPFLGVARLLALLAIFIPKWPRLTEWAYAGLVFDVVGAIYSMIAHGNPITDIIFPSVLLAVIFVSYFLHQKRLAAQS